VLPTLRSVLASSAVRAAEPEVLSGGDRLERAVRWVHVSEVREIPGLLEGGELILSTGLAMSGSGADAAAFLSALISAGACGLFVELSERFPAVPAPALRVARDRGFPIVALRKQARFVAITEEVHRAIVAEQYAHVQFAQRVHEVFTALSLESAPAQAIVETTAQMCGSSVVLEDLTRNVIAYSAHGRPAAGLLADWQNRSRLAPARDQTGISGPEGWMTTPVGVRGQSWGRIVVPDPATNQERLGMLLERAAQALELGRMVERDRVGIEFEAQGGLLTDLAVGRVGDEADALARARALGLSRAPLYVPVVARQRVVSDSDPVAVHRRGRRLIERVSAAVRAARLSALVGAIESHQVGLLVASPGRSTEDRTLAALADALGAQRDKQPDLDPITLGVGRGAASVVAAASTLRLAQHVAEVAASMPTGSRPPPPYYRNTDVRLRGLIALLHDDPRVQAFAESELDRLLVHEAKHGDGLVELLRQYLAVGGNKTELARVSHRSRPALYKRLDQIERILGVSLSDPASLLSLGVALMAYDEGRAR
jgi:purine catabolism regulator